MFRRGKLSFLSTKDDRIKVVNERINLTEKHLNEMRCNFADCTRKIAKQRDAYDELAKGFKNYADEEEINESLGEGMKSFTNAITILGDYMDINVHRMEVKIINELAQFENVCKTTRDNLRTAVIARDKEVLKQRHMLDLKTKFPANNSAADAELLKAQLEVNRTNKEIDEVINNFEKRKLNDIKTVLTDFILVSMKYHTKALEALSASYYDISNIDERADFVEFQKLMKTKEEPKTRKLGLKKALRSQSMDNLERNELLSPLKRRARSTKNLADKKDDDEEDDDDDEEEDDDDEEEEEDESEDNTNLEEEDSGTVSEDEDDPSEAKADKVDSNKSKSKLKDPFKAVAATHVLKHRSIYQSNKPFVARGSGIGIPAKSKHVEEGVAGGSNRLRLVTVVESKKRTKSSMSQAAEVIDCARSSTKTTVGGGGFRK